MMIAPGTTTKRKPLTKLQRAKLWAEHKGICYRCQLPIEPSKPFTDEHVIALGLSGSNDWSNRAPVHMHCAAIKTRDEDMPRINKAKAQQAVLVGKDPLAKPAIQSAGFRKSEKASKITDPFPSLPRRALYR